VVEREEERGTREAERGESEKREGETGNEGIDKRDRITSTRLAPLLSSLALSIHELVQVTVVELLEAKRSRRGRGIVL
jgi:hypothetical protein